MSESDTLLRTAPPVESLRTLLAGAVDYAGLFPPAKLPLEEAVAEYARIRSAPCAWMLGRFVAPLARLSELRKAVEVIHPSDKKWRITVTGDDPVQLAEAIVEFNAQQRAHAEPRMTVEALELRARDASEILEMADKVPAQLDCFFEIPLGERVADCAEAARTSGRFLKARTGGLTPESIPPAAALASFIYACVKGKVRFKLTAGLHHPLRSLHPLDHNPESTAVLLHGFLNVFLATAFAVKGASPAKLIVILEEQSPEALRFNATGAAWRNESIRNQELGAARRTIVSFGSCSFREPFDGLRKLGWL